MERDDKRRNAHPGPMDGTVHTPIRAVVFDLGGVLIEWDPRHLYRKLFADPEAMELFLREVCTPEWNARQDAGRPFAEAVAELVARHPEQRTLVEAYHARWEEMVPHALDDTVAVLAEVRATGLPLYALTNWSAETLPLVRPRFAFLEWFEHVVVSGEVGVIKPDPRIFEILLERAGEEAGACVFIDDTAKNVDAAAKLGFRAIRFTTADALRGELVALGMLR